MVVILKVPTGLKVRGCGKMVIKGSLVQLVTLKGEQETFEEVSELTVTEQTIKGE